MFSSAFAPSSMVWVTYWIFNIPVRIDALGLFVFFATFFEYNCTQ